MEFHLARVRRARWWWGFGLLIAAPALILALLGVRTMGLQQAERNRQQSQTALLVDSALSTVITRIEQDLSNRDKQSSGGPLWFTSDGAGRLIFWSDRVYVAPPGEEWAEIRRPLASALETACEKALAAEAQADYAGALAQYERIAGNRELALWARLAIARIRMREGPQALLEWMKTIQPADADGLAPDGSPVLLLATGYAGQAAVAGVAEIRRFLSSTLELLRSGRWWLSYEQRKIYDAQLTALLGSSDPDRRLMQIGAIDVAAIGNGPPAPRRVPITRALVAGSSTLLLILIPESGSESGWRGTAVAKARFAALADAELARIRRAVSYPLALGDSAGQVFWGEPAALVANRAFPAHALPGWVVYAGEPPSGFRERWLWYGFVAILLTTLVFGVIMTGRIVKRELELARLQGEFVAGVTHDFKSPITAIRLLAERIASGRAITTGNVRRYCEAVRDEADHLDQMVNRLLEAHRIQSGEKRYHIAPHCAADIAETAISHLRTQADAKSIRIALHADDTTREINLDRTAIQDALENLLDNAIKYSPPDTEVAIKVMHEPGELVIRVRDAGIGIDADDLPRIFDRFYRGRRSEAQSVKGTGLGLALVKAAAEGHGGSIEVASKPGQGSEFTIRIPIPQEEAYVENPHCG